MPKNLGTKTQQITTERTIKSFGVTIPDNGNPCIIDVSFSEIDKNASGICIAERPLPMMRITQQRAIEILPTGYLPSFPVLYSGLSQLFHTEWETQNT